MGEEYFPSKVNTIRVLGCFSLGGKVNSRVGHTTRMARGGELLQLGGKVNSHLRHTARMASNFYSCISEFKRLSGKEIGD